MVGLGKDRLLVQGVKIREGEEGIHLCGKAACRGVKILAVKEGFPPRWGLCIRCQSLSRGGGSMGGGGGWKIFL